MMQEPEVPDPDYDDPKEVYALFGLAYYSMQVLEQGLVNLGVALSVKEVPGARFKTVGEIYDAMDDKTFGQVLRATRDQTGIPPHFATDLEEALQKRNYLAHRFFVVHDLDIRSAEGRRRMVDELRDVVMFVKRLDKEMDKVWMRAWERLGVTQEWIDRQIERLRAAEAAPNVISRELG